MAYKIYKGILPILLLTLCGIQGKAQKDIDLNGTWDFWIPETEASAQLSASAKQHKSVTVPHTYNVMDGLEDYAGEACYRRTLPLISLEKGHQVRVHFNAVYHDAIVYVNGQKVGEHMNAGYTPFSFDITPYLKNQDGADNTLEVRCNNCYSENNIPWKRQFDWANDGGIYRSVRLHTSGCQSIRYVHVTPTIDLKDSSAVAHFDIKLWEPNIRKTHIALQITEKGTDRLVYKGELNLKLQKDSTFQCDIDCGKIKLWHFDNPNLYTFDVKIYDKKELSDQRIENFGFRQFSINDDHFTLNGETVRLPGIEDMPGSNPAFGMAEPKSWMEKTVKLMKDLGCTITRFHWVQDDYRLQLMDSLGIMVQEEISWWGKPSKDLSPYQHDKVREQLRELVEAHYNHPCIWGWGMSNEISDNHEEIRSMAEFTRNIDNFHIIDAVSSTTAWKLEDDPSFLLDLPTWNEYIGTWHSKDRGILPEQINKVGKALNGRPVFITEYGLCEPAHCGGDARRVDDMIYHISEWKKHPFICGYIYFCLEDYRTQMGEEGYGRDRIRRHGVCDKLLEPKASYFILQQIMNPLEITQVKHSGKTNHSTDITLRVKKDIPSYTIRGYKLEYMNDEGQTKNVPIPDLGPGNEYTLTITDINKSMTFRIVRANRSYVIEY